MLQIFVAFLFDFLELCFVLFFFWHFFIGIFEKDILESLNKVYFRIYKYKYYLSCIIRTITDIVKKQSQLFKVEISY